MSRAKYLIIAVAVALTAMTGLTVSSTDTQAGGGSYTTTWTTQSFTDDQNPDLVSEFSKAKLPTNFEKRFTMPENMERTYKKFSDQPLSGIPIPARSTATLLGPWTLGGGPGGECAPSEGTVGPFHGCVLVIVNVGLTPAYFPANMLANGWLIVAPYPNGEPAALAQNTIELISYLSTLTFEGRDGSHEFSWMNQCSAIGCDTVKVDGYLLDNSDRFTAYFGATLSK